MKKRSLLLLALMLLALSACAAFPRQRARTQVRVLLAGSLVVPFDELEHAFEAQHPDVDVLMEGHGSIQCVRHVSELGELADVVAVADYSLIPLLMYTTKVPETGRPYAEWTMQFATNQLGLAYTSQSAYADEITADNWYEILSRPDVLFGLADPRFDACGYRSMMAAQLATHFYNEPDLFYNLFGDRFTKPVRVQETDALDIILVPEVLEPEKGSGLELRGASVQLLGLLESGDLDYAFEYQSVSRQRNLRFLSLPPEINLSDPAYAEAYRRVRVKLDFRRFATVNPEFEGETILYGLTIPSNAPHPDLAAELIRFLIGPEGQQIMAENWQPLLLPPVVDNAAALPEALRP
ncbi:MAG: tungstate ABC transporter substrate-binding protein WtpA [Anaerolineae bacterium]|nr:tungstate ABC transporter substrate-binding protein WtpA [Anaerolineae bacterium]